MYSSSSVSSRPHSYFQLKALEKDIRVTLALTRRYINPLESPLYRLPSDLFSEIASYLTSESDLINATHVSYHLRDALLSYPNLWSYLNLEGETRARVFLERSGQTSLHIDMTKVTARTIGVFAELRQQSKRIAALKLGHWPTQNVFLSEAMPSLRRLEISCYCGDWDKEWDAYWTPAWGPTERVTSWSFSSLTSLIVRGLDPIPFYTPHLTRFSYWDHRYSIGPDSLLSFLDNCPILEHVNIVDLDESNRDKDDLVVSLPNLHTYTQTTFDNFCPLGVLNALSLASSCSITLKFDCDNSIVGDYVGPPRFENLDYLSDVRRVKLSTVHDAGGRGVVGTLELINAKGTRVRSKRLGSEKEPFVQEVQDDACNVAHLKFLRSLDSPSVETLCIDRCVPQDGVSVQFLKEALGFGGVKTLILSYEAARLCLSTLDEVPSAGGQGRRFLPIHTLIIYLEPDPDLFSDPLLLLLLRIAQRRKAAGYPFRSVSLFLYGDQGWDQVSELRECVEELEVVMGDGALDWNVNKYFLDGLDHLQKNQDVQWD